MKKYVNAAMKKSLFFALLVLGFGIFVACGVGTIPQPPGTNQPNASPGNGDTTGGTNAGTTGTGTVSPGDTPAVPPPGTSNGSSVVDIGEACHDPIEPGSCKKRGELRFAWDKDKGRCVAYMHYCSSSRNNFATMAGCRQLCPSSNGACFVGDVSYANGEKFNDACNACECIDGNASCTKRVCTPPSICNEAPDSGAPCKAFMTVWSYNSELGKCIKRGGYGGCGKSKNVFSSEAECQKTCR